MLFTASYDSYSKSRGEEEEEETNMMYSWGLGIMLPAFAVAYQMTDGSVLYATAAALAIPMLAIAQGSVGILTYRLYFGDAPLPLSPSHGVVQCSSSTSESHDTLLPPKQSTSASRLSLGCQCGDLTATTTLSSTCDTSSNLLVDNESRSDNIDDTASTSGESRTASLVENNDDDDQEEEEDSLPLRLLVIGDSLAIGVGQARQCTPIMPEVIAKTLSQATGRVVYWTCHGAPGASTGWIVRELERGVQDDTNNNTCQTEEEGGEVELDEAEEDEHDVYDDESEVGDVAEKSMDEKGSENQSSCSDTDDDSSSDDSSLETCLLTSSRQQQRVNTAKLATKKQREVWRERLAQHRKRFHPDALGPYDVVIVLTGSNDLKSAFFPFLLTGEDAEFRRQAKARGGNYNKELRRLLETLNTGMRSQLQSIRESMEAATESVIEKVEETMERITPRRNSVGGGREKMDSNSTLLKASDNVAASENVASESSDNTTTTTTAEASNDIKQKPHFPLVVLPGLPARALPIFRSAPLRWLAVPIVDTLDNHKRELSNSHPGEVLFVPPPSIDDLSKFENCTGEIWRQRCREEPVLTLRDIRRRDCRRIESDMREYYEVKDQRVPTGVGLLKKYTGRSFFSKTPAPGTSVFSVDGIHPVDDGYDFWGRYIANAIVDEWKTHKKI